MRRLLAVSVPFLFVAVLGSVFFVPRVSARSDSTVSLRKLFLESDLVVVGTIGKLPKWERTKPGENEDGEDERRSYHRAIPIKIEETLRGVAPDELFVAEDKPRWSGDEPAEEETQLDFRDGQFGELSQVKYRRLFFLKKDEQTGLYRENARNRSFLMNQEDLQGYISRLRELQNIYSQPEPSMKAVVEWLVSMAEDSNTRYDASYELRKALVDLREEQEEEKEAEAEAKDEAEAENEPQPAESDEHTPQAGTDSAREPDLTNLQVFSSSARPPLELGSLQHGEVGDEKFAKLITPAQKERLLQAFLSITFNYQNTVDEASPFDRVLESQDRTLLSLVAEFHDPRLTGHLLNQLPLTAKYDCAVASELMEVIAEDLGDDRLRWLASSYGQIMWRPEPNLVDEDEILKNAFDEGEKKSPVKESSITYGQMRPELLRQFLDRSVRLIFDGAAPKEQKSEN